MSSRVGYPRVEGKDNFPALLVFPEGLSLCSAEDGSQRCRCAGTATNGRALISFKPGAFRPGLPVQPVALRYPFKRSELVIAISILAFTSVFSRFNPAYSGRAAPRDRDLIVHILKARGSPFVCAAATLLTCALSG